MKANIQAVSLKITTLKSTNTMANAMKGVTKAMSTMNRQVRAKARLLIGYFCIYSHLCDILLVAICFGLFSLDFILY